MCIAGHCLNFYLLLLARQKCQLLHRAPLGHTILNLFNFKNLVCANFGAFVVRIRHEYEPFIPLLFMCISVCDFARLSHVVFQVLETGESASQNTAWCSSSATNHESNALHSRTTTISSLFNGQARTHRHQWQKLYIPLLLHTKIA